MPAGFTEQLDTFLGSEEGGWHGYGYVKQGVLTTQDLEMRGLGWTVSLQPLYLWDGALQLLRDRDHQGLIRDDLAFENPSRILEVVGKRYEPWQNLEMMEFVNTVAGEAGALIETAGSLQGGKVVWSLVRLPGDFTINTKAGPEAFDGYLLVTIGHGGEAIEILLTKVRVVCQNTMEMARKENGRMTYPRWSIQHRKNLRARIEDIRLILTKMWGRAREEQELMEWLAAAPLDNEQAKAVLGALIKPSSEGDRAKANAHTTRLRIADLYTNKQPHAKELFGTRYGFYQAVAQWADHDKPKTMRNPDVRESKFTNRFWGEGAEYKRQCLELLLEDGSTQEILVDVPPSDGSPTVDEVLAGIDLGGGT